MDPVIGISWPRSGHHMLVRLLIRYFGPGFGYCEFHAGHPNVGGITTCCKTVPCKHRDIVNLTKNHDFDLATPQIPGQKYLIQYRDFVPSVVSNFELFVRNGQEDSDASFRKFASMEFGRYQGFIEKWVRSDFARDQLVLSYNAFTADPARELARVVAFMDPGGDIDAGRIDDAIAQIDGERIERRKVESLQGVGVHKPRDVTQFRYYRATLFKQLEKLRLSRGQVLEIFQAVLGRSPQENNILDFQCFDSAEALQAHLMASAEYRQRMESEPQTPQSDSDK